MILSLVHAFGWFPERWNGCFWQFCPTFYFLFVKRMCWPPHCIMLETSVPFYRISGMLGTFLAVQWLRLRLPMQGVQLRSLVGELRFHMPHGQKTQNIKQKQYCNKFNKDFKNGPQQKKSLKKKKKNIWHADVHVSLIIFWETWPETMVVILYIYVCTYTHTNKKPIKIYKVKYILRSIYT